MTINERRFYTDEEVAVILREAAQSADSPAGTRGPSPGLSLEQIKAAAAEAGLDPSVVERVALRIAEHRPASLLERIAGGPMRHRETIHLDIRLSERVTTHLLSAIRAAAEVPGQGSADAAGFSWHAWQRHGRVSVTAHQDARGTRVQVLVDRTSSAVMRAIGSLVGIVIWFSMSIEQVMSLPELLVMFAVPIGVLAAARAFWKSSTRAVRERTARLLDAVRESPPAE